MAFWYPHALELSLVIVFHEQDHSRILRACRFGREGLLHGHAGLARFNVPFRGMTDYVSLTWSLAPVADEVSQGF
jgi:hypothetical protein